MTKYAVNRRSFLGASTALVGLAMMPSAARAEGEVIKIGTLTPLTGAGGPYGPIMTQTAQAVVDEVNAAGGVLGKQIELISEDDQTNPEAGVRAARKLIDVDQVSAILGTWASSVTTAVAPLCWESGTFLATVSGADAITELPHNGYLVRTQPNTTLQGRKFGEFALEKGAKRVFFVSPQTPFAESQYTNMAKAVEAGGGEAASLVYDDKKPSYRSEVDEIMRFNPDAVVLGGYAPDTTVMLKELYRAGFEGTKIAFAYAVNQQVLDGVQKEVVEGCYTIAPSSNENSTAYKRLVDMIGVESPDPYTVQVYDQINLIIMAMAAAGESTGTAIKDSVRTVSQGEGGTKVDNAIDGLKLIAEGKAVDYDGASGPCDFTDTGDISDSSFRYEQVLDGKFSFINIA